MSVADKCKIFHVRKKKYAGDNVGITYIKQ
jgi:hypothetical protein